MSKFPVYLAGVRLTAALLATGQPDVIMKTNTTTRASNATVSDDPDMSVSLPTVGSYFVEFLVKYQSTTAAGIKTAWNVGAIVSSTQRQEQGLMFGASDGTPSGTAFATRAGLHNYATQISYGSGGVITNPVWLYEWAIVDVTTPGNVTFQWAQQASTAVNTATLPGSLSRATRYL